MVMFREGSRESILGDPEIHQSRNVCKAEIHIIKTTEGNRGEKIGTNSRVEEEKQMVWTSTEKQILGH